MFKKIYIEITNICNLKCEFCIPCKREARMMSVSDFEEVIKKVCRYTKVVTLHVKGEPLLHKNLEGILDIIHKYNLHVNITLVNDEANNELDSIVGMNGDADADIPMEINFTQYLGEEIS